MNDWLSEIEGYPRIQDIPRMARVIRELAKYLKFEGELPMRYETKEAAQQSRDAWHNLSLDAKELVTPSVASSDSAEKEPTQRG